MNMSQCIASRDWTGARNEGIAYAMECIFGGGHGYSKGELLTEADLNTCRECAEEALNAYSQAVDGEDAAEEHIAALAAEAAAVAQEKIDALQDSHCKTLRTPHRKTLRMKIESRAGERCDSDCTIGYDEDGTPIAVVEESDGGFFVEIAEGEYVHNQYEGYYWYVQDGQWQSVTDTCPSAIADMTERDANDGTQDVYDAIEEVE